MLLFIITAGIVYADSSLPASPPSLDGLYGDSGILSNVSTCEVYNTKTALCMSHTEIRLKPGFHAKAGSTFRARIGNYSSLLNNSDNDNDGLPDWWEIAMYSITNPSGIPGLPADSNVDSDNDGLPDSWEVDTYGNLNHDFNDDCDSDGFIDGLEWLAGSLPCNSGDTPKKGSYYHYDQLGRVKQIIRVE